MESSKNPILVGVLAILGVLIGGVLLVFLCTAVAAGVYNLWHYLT